MRSLATLLLGASLAACLPHPPPAPPPTELDYVPGCGDSTYPPVADPTSLERLAGRYRLDDTVLAVVSDGGRLWLDRPGFTRRQLGPAAGGRFVDGCGLTYSFAPESGPASVLAIILADGTASRWQRIW